MFNTEVKLKDFVISNNKKIVLIAGLNVLEDERMALDTASKLAEVSIKYQIPLIFKASYDKANRTSFKSYRGPGIKKGLAIFNSIKKNFNLPILTDVHTNEEAKAASQFCDVIQLPAFLARQTDLIKEMATTGRIINIKKPQFLSPSQIKNIVEKFHEFGNYNLLLCERGTCFGYDNLIVDMLGFNKMKSTCKNLPLIFDVTHSLQCRVEGQDFSDGRRSDVLNLAMAGVCQSIAGIFIETHPDPNKALCDGPSALPLDLIDEFVSQIQKVDNLIKAQPKFEVS